MGEFSVCCSHLAKSVASLFQQISIQCMCDLSGVEDILTTSGIFYWCDMCVTLIMSLCCGTGGQEDRQG